MAKPTKEELQHFVSATLKHSSIISDLEDRLKNSLTKYTIIKKEQLRFDSVNIKSVVGECDLYALYTINDENYLLCFEVKARHSDGNKKHALQQLNRDIDYYSKLLNPTRIFQFYVCGDDEGHRIKWITENRTKKINREYLMELKEK
ncbi:MAG: hypothetical protein ACP5N1_05320 [Candidatus Woesearchaeota archaeon]